MRRWQTPLPGKRWVKPAAPPPVRGYVYKGQRWHPGCLRLPTGPGQEWDGWGLAEGAMSAEANLNEIAWAYGFDRSSPSTFSPDEFPHVIAIGAGRCGGCNGRI